MSRELVFFSTFSSILVLFLVIPLVICLVVGGPHIVEIASDLEALDAMRLSFYAGVTSSLLITSFGTPLAYLLSRKKGMLANIVESFLEIPLALPHSVAGIMVLLAYNSRAPLGLLLSNLGIIIEDSYWGIVFAMAFVSSPIFITAMRAGFDSVDIELENVARSLGASEIETFFKISLPLAFRHLVAGFILSLARAISEVGAVMIVAYYPKVVATLIIERFLGYGLRAVLALSTVLALVSLTVFAILRFLLKGGE
ncbi:molybdenum ABC transporter permease [Candidatus Geothermarchaeota archaeon]|nr:MAG: molybdenum ABC transporter permease [Candidatus Geothermarchaeota archaeon]